MKGLTCGRTHFLFILDHLPPIGKFLWKKLRLLNSSTEIIVTKSILDMPQPNLELLFTNDLPRAQVDVSI